MVAAIVTFIVQILTKRWFAYILKIPYHYLHSVILVISFIGGFGISKTMFNIYSARPSAGSGDLLRGMALHFRGDQKRKER